MGQVAGLAGRLHRTSKATWLLVVAANRLPESRRRRPRTAEAIDTGEQAAKQMGMPRTRAEDMDGQIERYAGSSGARLAYYRVIVYGSESPGRHRPRHHRGRRGLHSSSSPAHWIIGRRHRSGTNSRSRKQRPLMTLHRSMVRWEPQTDRCISSRSDPSACRLNIRPGTSRLDHVIDELDDAIQTLRPRYRCSKQWSGCADTDSDVEPTLAPYTTTTQIAFIDIKQIIAGNGRWSCADRHAINDPAGSHIDLICQLAKRADFYGVHYYDAAEPRSPPSGGKLILAAAAVHRAGVSSTGIATARTTSQAADAHAAGLPDAAP